MSGPAQNQARTHKPTMIFGLDTRPEAGWMELIIKRFSNFHFPNYYCLIFLGFLNLFSVHITSFVEFQVPSWSAYNNPVMVIHWHVLGTLYVRFTCSHCTNIFQEHTDILTRKTKHSNIRQTLQKGDRQTAAEGVVPFHWQRI